VPGLETFEAPVDAAARRHGVTVHKLPHFDLTRLIKYAVLRPHVPNADKIRELRWGDINDAMRLKTGIPWVAAGERASDSLQRRFYTRKEDGVQPQYRRVFPIWDWVDSDVYGYLRARGIPTPFYGDYTEQRGSGFSLKGKGLAWLKRHAPRDYQRVLKVFPYAEAEVLRYEQGEQRQAAAARVSAAAIGGEQAERVPKVRDRARASQHDRQCPLQPTPEAQPSQAAKTRAKSS
jgi:phosphoadenosine phosphosulfate reductase